MNASQIWSVLSTNGLRNARSLGPLFYGKGAVVKKHPEGWMVVPCGATLFDLEQVMAEANDSIREVLTRNNISFKETSKGFLIPKHAEVAELVDAQG